MEEIYFEEGENYHIKKKDIVKVTRFEISNEIEVKHTTAKGNGLRKFKKLDKYTYVNTETGEIKNYKLSKEKKIKNMRRALKKLKSIIRNNFYGKRNEIFVTMTTEKVETSFENIVQKFKKFWRKLLNKNKDKKLEYIYVVELQEKRNSWHIHTLIKDTENRNLFIENEEIKELWGEGFTKTTRVVRGRTNNKTKENIIRDEVKEYGIENLIDYMAKVRTKEKIENGKRLYYCSRGIKQPLVEKLVYEEIEEQLKDNYILDKEDTLLVKDSKTNNIINKIKKENYKKIKN